MKKNSVSPDKVSRYLTQIQGPNCEKKAIAAGFWHMIWGIYLMRFQQKTHTNSVSLYLGAQNPLKSRSKI